MVSNSLFGPWVSGASLFQYLCYWSSNSDVMGVLDKISMVLVACRFLFFFLRSTACHLWIQVFHIGYTGFGCFNLTVYITMISLFHKVPMFIFVRS